MEKIRIHIAEDHDLFKEGVVSNFENDSINYEIVGYTKKAGDTISWFRGNKADVLILDIGIPDIFEGQNINGIDVLRFLQKNEIDVNTLVCSVDIEKRFAMETYKLGALGYVCKGHDFSIVDAVENIYKGDSFYSSKLYRESIFEAQEEIILTSTLTEKEIEVLSNISEKRTPEQTRGRLGISESTFRVHKLNIRRKLNLKNSAGLAKFALLFQKSKN